MTQQVDAASCERCSARAERATETKRAKKKTQKTRLLVPVPRDGPRQLVARAGPGDVKAEDGRVPAEGADLIILLFSKGKEVSQEGQP